MEPQELALDLVREFNLAATRRGIWENHWEQVARVVLPYYSTSFYAQGNMTPGLKRNQFQFDVTANTALWRFAAAMESELTPANSQWHRIRPSDPYFEKFPEVRRWYDLVNDTLFRYRYSPHSGFQANMHDGYASIGAFGTSCLFTDAFADPARPEIKGLRYRQVYLGELFYATNHQGQVDKVFRRFKMTLRQLLQKFGQAALPADFLTKLERNPEEEVQVIHVCQPNTRYEPGTLDSRAFRFSSHYVLLERKHLLQEGGFRTFPYAISRYVLAPGEIYGRGPAMNVLPSINVLNEEKKVILKAGHRAVDPVLRVHDDGILDGFSLKPGALNSGAVSSDGRPLIHPLPVGDLNIGKELLDDERAVINDAFLVTLFQILVQTPQMTATEVIERASEKGALLSPTMGRFQSEALGPLIEREFDLLMSQGCIPPPPRILVEARAEYKVEYDAPLNRQMKAAATAGIMRTVSWTAETASQAQDPTLMDNFNFDVIIPDVADTQSVPFRYLATPEEKQAKRQKREQDQQGAQLAQALPGIAAMTKAVQPQGGAPSLGGGR